MANEVVGEGHRVRFGPMRSNRHDPENDRNSQGPRVISTAQAPGGLNETYCVSMPRPLWATRTGRGEGEGACRPMPRRPPYQAVPQRLG